MFCPKCAGEMESLEFDGVEVDRCKECRGIWFDVGERDALQDGSAAASIDTGDPAVGKETNNIDRYRCPRCDGGMMRTSDPRRPEVWYEECTSCRGSFFDAGEFAELTQEAVGEFVTRLMTPGRR